MSVVPNVVSDSPPSSAASLRLDSAPASSGTSCSHVTLSKAYEESVRNPEEKAHWDEVCRAYRQYAAFAVKQFGWNHPARIAHLHAAQQAVLPRRLICGTPEFDQMAREYKDAAIRNQFFLDCILRHAGKPHSQQYKDSSQLPSTDVSKVSSVLKSLARDWSVAGSAERAMAYTPILHSLDAYVPMTNNKTTTSNNNGVVVSPRKVCVPGAGVGRLACEIAAKGYAVQGS
jgi:N2227-like protein